MNKYQPRNYTAHGGKETVIGGKVTFLPGAEVEGLPAAVLMPKVSALPDSDAKSVAQLREDYNALIGVLRAAGLLASEAVVE